MSSKTSHSTCLSPGKISGAYRSSRGRCACILATHHPHTTPHMHSKNDSKPRFLGNPLTSGAHTHNNTHTHALVGVFLTRPKTQRYGWSACSMPRWRCADSQKQEPERGQRTWPQGRGVRTEKAKMMHNARDGKPTRWVGGAR
jgi:hypothetical protein